MNQKKLVTSLLLIIILFFGNQVLAQDATPKANKASISMGADVMSRYIWRGSQFGGNSPSLQPSLSIGYGNLTFGAWGAYSLSGSNTGQEFDLSLNYTFLNNALTAGICDYYFPDESGDYQYFNWNNDATGHVLEASLGFNGTDKLPLTFLAAVNFYGADAIKVNNDPYSPDFNSKDGIKYSNYFELGYSFNVNDISCNAFMGGTLNQVKKADNFTGYVGETGYYGTGPGIVNLGITATKSIPVTEKFSLPLSASIITNPQTQKVFFVFGFSL
jgi:hypothetical protein